MAMNPMMPDYGKPDPMGSVSSGPMNQSNPSPGGIGPLQTVNMRATGEPPFTTRETGGPSVGVKGPGEWGYVAPPMPDNISKSNSGPFPVGQQIGGDTGTMPMGIIGRTADGFGGGQPSALQQLPGGFLGGTPRTPLGGQAGVGGMAQVGAQIQDAAARQRAGMVSSPSNPPMTAVRGEGAATGYSAPDYATAPGQNFYGR